MIASPDLSPRGWNGGPMKYGASMGRPSTGQHIKGTLAGFKLALRRVRVNGQGYDAGGAYWGCGARLCWAGSDCGAIDRFFRAADRAAARAAMLADYPGARFYR